MRLVKSILWINLVILGLILLAFNWLPYLLVVVPGFLYLLGLVVIISAPFLGLIWGHRYRNDLKRMPYRILWFASGLNVILLIGIFVMYYL